MTQRKDQQGSDVARILQQITAEYEAAYQGMSGFAHVSQHKYITARMENIGRLHGELETLVGDQAMPLIVAHTEHFPDTSIEKSASSQV